MDGLGRRADGGAVLYALVGGEEIRPGTVPSTAPGMGHWPWGMWEGHEYSDPKTNFGFGRTFLAIDPATKKILWNHREQQYVDARGMCMKNGRIYFYSPGNFLGCLDAASGHLIWKNSDQDLLAAIGPDGPAQNALEGYATTTFIKCTDKYLFFAGPQRTRLVVASTEDGKLVWQKEPGNLQLVLRDDSLYCAGPSGTTGYRLADATGEQLGLLPARRACTRATGTVDSVFFRATGGTVRIDVADNTAKHIAPMRPPCQDGVIVSDGLLYWGPWMCGCQLSLYGHICLEAAGNFNFRPAADDSRLATFAEDLSAVEPFEVQPGDWPTYLGDNARSGVTEARLPDRVTRRWTYQIPGRARPTAPIIAGGLVFVGDTGGTLRALDAKDGSLALAGPNRPSHLLPAGCLARAALRGLGRRAGLRLRGRHGPAVVVLPRGAGRPLDSRLRQAHVHLAGGRRRGRGRRRGVCRRRHRPLRRHLRLCPGRHHRQSEMVQRFLRQPFDQATECGVSLQGPLSLADGELRFLGGGKYETARYDLQTRAMPQSAPRYDHVAVPHGLLSVLPRVRPVYVAQPPPCRWRGADLRCQLRGEQTFGPGADGSASTRRRSNRPREESRF